MNVYSIAFYRATMSEYEQPEAGAGRGNYFRNYVRAVVRAFHSVWPDWSLWIHHDERVKEFPEFALLQRYQGAGLLRLVPMGEAKTLTGSMLWRLWPAFDGAPVDRILCRDIDSLPQPRERKAVERWLQVSSFPVHALHDSTSHRGTVILGGMCGFIALHVMKRFGSWGGMLDAMRESGVDFDRKGGDQHFLNWAFPNSNEILCESVDTELWDRDRNFCEGYARCLGGGFNADKTAAWYDRQGYTNPKILECERA